MENSKSNHLCRSHTNPKEGAETFKCTLITFWQPPHTGRVKISFYVAKMNLVRFCLLTRHSMFLYDNASSKLLLWPDLKGINAYFIRGNYKCTPVVTHNHIHTFWSEIMTWNYYFSSQIEFEIDTALLLTVLG